jgi:hypothetical protein
MEKSDLMNTRSTKDESFKKVCSCVIILSQNKHSFQGKIFCLRSQQEIIKERANLESRKNQTKMKTIVTG